MSDSNFRVFVVEDDDWYRQLLEYHFSMDPDLQVESFGTVKGCLDRMEANPDLITLDYRLPDMNGAEALARIKADYPDVHVIIISEQKDIEVVVDLLKQGAEDYLVKSDEIQARLLNTTRLLRQNKGLRKQVSQLQKEVGRKFEVGNGILGQSPAIEKVFALIETATRADLTVMISGETGTGKELVAKAIHYHSKRKEKPFVTLNMAAIPSELMESELFGHKKGSFTGAISDRKGKFEEAHSGTLFLDEIGELELHLQAKLLRVLQEKEVTPVGSNTPIQLDCRILVATHKNLAEEVKAGRFREDLFYRLFGLQIELPPLRERGKDVLIIARRTIEEFCAANELEVRHFSTEAQNKLCSYRFPGNVRELKSIVELACVMAPGTEIGPEHLRFGSQDLVPDLLSRSMTLREYNHQIVQTYLERHDHNIPMVAEKLDIGVATIYRMLKEIKGE